MAVIGINYTGGNIYDGDTDNIIDNDMVYESVSLFIKGNKTLIFNSSNFVKDWFDAKKKYVEIMHDEPFLSASSTCNHFQWDGGKFDSAYLHTIDDVPVLKYMDDSKLIDEQTDVYNGWEFFVDEGTKPTWEELKEICK